MVETFGEYAEMFRKQAARIIRPPKELIEEFKKLDCCSAFDGLRFTLGIRTQLMDIRPMFDFMRDKVYVGPAITLRMLRCFYEAVPTLTKRIEETGRSREDFHLGIIDNAQPGDIIVLGTIGYDTLHLAYWGECLSNFAKAHGVQATVVEGSIRDSRDIEKLEYPVFARGTTPAGLYEYMEGVEINVPVQLCNVTVRPGDIIMGDADGVIVIPQQHAETCLKFAKEKKERERRSIENALAGKPALESLPPGRSMYMERYMARRQAK